MDLRKVLLLTAVLTLTLLGCKLAAQTIVAPTATPTVAPPEATSTLAPTDTPTPTQETVGLQASETPLAEPQATPTEAQPAVSPTPAGARETQQAQSMAALLERLAGDGAIGSKDGDYYRIDDFDQSFAQIGWYQWWKTGFSAENFVMSANTAWESASKTANWPDAGCGVVFSLGDKDNHIITYLGLDGFVRIGQVAGGNYKLLASKRYGKVSIPNGDAKIVLAVFNKRVSYYVNDTQVGGASASSIKSGDIALTLLSGTNKDFGTRCKMTNIDLWILR